jgi:hypothetical protein
MSINNVNNSQNISVAQYLDKLQTSNNNTDIAYLVFQAQVQGLNKQVTESLANIQTTGKVRDAYSKKLKALRDLKALAARCEPDSKKQVSTKQLYEKWCDENGFKGTKMNDNSPTGKEAWAAFSSHFDPAIAKPEIAPDGTVTLVRDKDQDMYSISGDEIDGYIESTKDDVRKIDSEREMGMIMLNTWMNKKGNAVSQLTALIKGQHDTEKSVINRLGV